MKESNWYYDYEEFVCSVSDMFMDVKEKDSLNDISIIAKYEDARQIIKELVCIGYDLRCIDIHDEEFDGYCDEYVISVCNTDGKDEVWCEPMLRENGYLTDDSTVIYVLDNCSSKVLPHLKGEHIFEVRISEEDEDCECDEYCDCCSFKPDASEKYVEYSKDNDGDMHGFSVSRSDGNSYYGFSFYSTDKLSEKDIQGLLQEHGF